MAETRYKEVGSITTTKQQAEAEVAQKWYDYKQALDYVGDTIVWDNDVAGRLGGEITETVKNSLGYFTHTEAATYEEFEHTATETKQESSSSSDYLHTVKTKIYEPVKKVCEISECLKVVKRGQAKRVKELQNEFIKEASNYCEVKAGFSSDLPRKSLSIAYNILLLLSGLFLVFFVLFSPVILPEYAQSLSADILLLKLMGAQGLPINAPAWISYVSIVFGVGCIIAFFYVNSKLSKWSYHPTNRVMIVYLIAVIAAFALGYLMNDWYKDMMTSNNPLLWVPFGLFCACRALTPVLSVFAIILAIKNLVTNYPHKKICGTITEKANRLNDYINSGRYQKSCDLLAQITSYSVNNAMSICEEVAKIVAKINEINQKKQKLKHIEDTEFTDKSKEIAELDVRLNKAQARIKELCGNNEITKSADTRANDSIAVKR